VWTWDITKLPGPVKGVSFALYVVLDLFSRFVVGWTLARRQLASIAEALLRETCEKHGVRPGQLTIHSDRGAPMTAKPVAMLFADLGIIASLSRPRVSNDNPFSEAQFRTAKDAWDYPGRFDSPQHGRAWAQPFFHRYNTQHRHSSLAMLTPEVVFTGRAHEVLAARHAVLRAAYEAHPERFVHGPPKLPELPKEVWINPTPRSLEPEPSH
jgi:putative transposase